MLALAAAVARFGAGEGHADGLAVALLGLLGVLLLGVGTRRYYQVAADLERGRFTFSRHTPVVVAAWSWWWRSCSCRCSCDLLGIPGVHRAQLGSRAGDG